MEKDFDGWNKRKKQLQKKKEVPFCHEREVWWSALGVNVGFEQDGSSDDYRRPVLILRHVGGQTYLVVPLTTSSKIHPMRLPLGIIGRQNAYAALSQMRVIDTRRLTQKVETIDEKLFDEIRKTIKDML